MENEKKQRRTRLMDTFPKFLFVMLFSIIATVSFAQNKNVTGVVVDGNNEPVIGASVIVDGTTNGTITDFDGKFSLTNVPANGNLKISYIGYVAQTVSVAGKTMLNITLKEDSEMLDEVVVVGYGVQKRSDVTGAITSVNEKTLRERPVQNAISAMQGKAAGVDVQTNVRPGETSDVVIRGTRSIKADNKPLYVVDGIVLMGDINDINPNDIESMEILKDASSTAIYGSRGANGVVLITTKSGKEGKVSIDYNATFSADIANSITEWASAGEMLDRVRAANINGGTYKLGTQVLTEPNMEADIQMFGHSDAASIAAIQKAYEGGTYDSSRVPTTDWIDLITRTGTTQNHQLAISAGNEKSKLYMSLGYYDVKGIQKNQGYERFTARINGESKLTNWLSAGMSLSASYGKQKYGTMTYSGSATGARDLYGRALSQMLIAKPYDENGELIEYPGGNASTPVWNPLIDLYNADDRTRRVNIQGNLFADVTFTPWLRYRLNVGTNYNNVKTQKWLGSQSTINRKGNPATASAENKSEDRKNWMIENILFFNKEVGIHTFGATFVQSAQKSNYEQLYANANQIYYNSAKWWDLAANLAGNPTGYGSGFSETTLMSYMGRVNYGLLNRYLLSAALRYDGSSVLAPGNKWDYFPSAAVAWKIHEEAFMKKIDWISELKLRLGYGVTGNAAVSAYTTSGPLNRYNYVYGTTAGIGMLPKNMPNPGLGWEKTAQFNVGLDFAVLNRRLTGTIEWYQSNTTDLLMDRSIPGVTGFSSILDNIGEMKNSGIELTLSSVNIDKSDFRWSTDFNLSHNKEEIVSLVNGKEDMSANGWYIGHPLSVYRYYVVDGLWQNTPEDLAEIAEWKKNGYTFEPGHYKPVEVNKNYKLEDDDKQIIGNRTPKVVLGMTNTFNYKNWELSFFLYGRLGQKYYSSLNPNVSGNYIVYGRKASLNDFWSEDNTGAKYPKLTTSSTGFDANVNRSANIHDGSFIAVRNISLSYTFNPTLISKINMRQLQVYTQVLNPFLFGGEVVRAGINPEDTNNLNSFNSQGDLVGATNNNTMMVTSFVFGVRIGF